MFELLTALKYFIPKKKQLSISLIGLVSLLVISLVVWLLLIFLSITEGMEKNWLNKLTALNAPIKITPTSNYYSSYYYQVDALSSASDFSYKSLTEKKMATTSDPYNPEEDETLPLYFAEPDLVEGKLIDPVKALFISIKELEKTQKSLQSSIYEMGGALMRLEINHSPAHTPSLLSQATYLSSLPSEIKPIQELINDISINDINALLLNHELAQKKPYYTLSSIFSNIDVNAIEINTNDPTLTLSLLPQNRTFQAYAEHYQETILSLSLPTKHTNQTRVEQVQGRIFYENGDYIFASDSFTKKLPLDTILSLEEPLSCEVSKTVLTNNQYNFVAHAVIQGHKMEFIIPWNHQLIKSAKIHTHFNSQPKTSPPWVHYIKQGDQYSTSLPEYGALLPKNMQDHSVQIGSSGHLAYSSTTTTSTQEHQMPMFVSGFYDPGILSVGARILLINKESASKIGLLGQMGAIDPLMQSGIQLWYKNLENTQALAHNLKTKLNELNIDSYWNITPYYDYDFAKDLIKQFQSDRTLFTLIGSVILLIACCNILSLLLLLVQNKKQEIGIYLALGASKKSIALIFCLVGTMIGLLSVGIGTFLAWITLGNIDSIIAFLSRLQGYDILNPIFYGDSLAASMSKSSLIFIFILAPLLSILASFFPAMKACSIEPSKILRSE